MPYLSLIVDIIPLLLHVVGDEYLRHEDLLAGLLLLFDLSLAATVHSLLGADIQPLSLILIVSLALLKQGFLGYSKLFINKVLRTQCSPLVIYNTINYIPFI